MTIDLETVRRMATLSRLNIPEGEQAQVAKELDGILNWVAQLNEVNVDGVEPLTSVNDSTLRRRADIVNDGNDPEGVLANAPSKKAGFFIVPKVVE